MSGEMWMIEELIQQMNQKVDNWARLFVKQEIEKGKKYLSIG